MESKAQVEETQQQISGLNFDTHTKSKVGVTDPEEAKETCALCKTITCCPDHCCNVLIFHQLSQWDTCPCSDCDNCRANKTKFKEENKYEHYEVPKVFFKSSGSEEVVKLNTKIAKSQPIPEDESQFPQEQVRATDGALITNYEVQVEVEEDILYAGGVRGIRALKQQRDQLTDSPSIPEEKKNQYHKYESPKKGQDGEESKATD